MNLRLTIEGSASQLAMILASLPDGVAIATGDQCDAHGVWMPPASPPPMISAPAALPMPSGQPVSDEADDDASGGVNTNPAAVDRSGLPWDERIHASTKTTKADGTWTGRRGGPKGAEYDAIVAELRARAGQVMPPVMQQPVPMPAPQPIPPMPVNPNGTPPVAAPMPPPMPAMPDPAAMASSVPAAAPVYSPPPMPAPVAAAPLADVAAAAGTNATGTLDFAQFMQHLSGQMVKRDGAGAPIVHAEYLGQITAEISTAFQLPAPLTAITDIASDPQKISYAIQLMQRDGRW